MFVSVIIIVVLTALFSYLSTLVPTPSDQPNWYAFHVPFILYIIFGMFHIGAAGYFLRGIQGFTSNFRKAYLLIAWGVAILGLSQLQTPVLQAMYLWYSPWVTWSGPDVTYFAGILLTFIGLSKFVTLLGIKTKFTRLPVVAGLAVAGLIIGLAVPYASEVTYGLSTLQYRWNLVMVLQSTMLSLAVAGAAFQVWRSVGAFYRKSSRWFALAVAGTFISNVQASLFAFIGYENFYVKNGFYSFLPVIVAILYLRAGYTFMKMTRDQGRKTGKFTSVDVVVYAAGLVSNTANIDSVLDKMRGITARINPSTGLSEQDQNALRDVYMGIESYLVSREPAHPYTQQELRAKMEREFDFDHNANPVFWQDLPR